MVLVLTAFINMRGVLTSKGKMSNPHFLMVALLIWVVVFVPLTASAQMSVAPLSGPEIRASLFGRLFTGEYPNGLGWAERFNANGTSDYSEKGRSTRGIMSLNGNVLCFSYQDNNEVGGCFEIWKRSANCFDFYSASDGPGLTDRRFGRDWQARGWASDQPSTCLSDRIS